MATIKPRFLPFERLRFAKAETKGETELVIPAPHVQERKPDKEARGPRENVYTYEQQPGVC
jgi:hypothetical protein